MPYKRAVAHEVEEVSFCVAVLEEGKPNIVVGIGLVDKPLPKSINGDNTRAATVKISIENSAREAVLTPELRRRLPVTCTFNISIQSGAKRLCGRNPFTHI